MPEPTWGSEVVAKLRPRSATTHLGTDQVTIELAANEGQGSGTCPQGETTSDVWMARAGTDRPVRLVRFPAATGGAWSPREGWLGGGAGRVPHPVRPPPGWQVHLHDQEAVLQEARAAQQTTEQRRALREQLRPRAKIERTSK